MNLTTEELERKFYIENNPLYYQLVKLIAGMEEQAEEDCELSYKEGISVGYGEGYGEAYGYFK